jgi:hypothetical protein
LAVASSPSDPNLPKFEEGVTLVNRIRLFLTAILASTLVAGSLLAAAVAAGDRIPVSSVDDTSISIANRIAAVDNVVVAVDGRLGRILAAYPPGPPVVPVSDSLVATRQSLGVIINSVDARLCTTDGIIGTGDASLADGDIYASDSSSTGLLNQLSSVRGVLSEANGRLVRIYGAYPPGPPTDEVRAELTAVRTHAVAGFDAIASRLGDAIHPPSPCAPSA